MKLKPLILSKKFWLPFIFIKPLLIPKRQLKRRSNILTLALTFIILAYSASTLAQSPAAEKELGPTPVPVWLLPLFFGVDLCSRETPELNEFLTAVTRNVDGQASEAAFLTFARALNDFLKTKQQPQVGDCNDSYEILNPLAFESLLNRYPKALPVVENIVVSIDRWNQNDLLHARWHGVLAKSFGLDSPAGIRHMDQALSMYENYFADFISSEDEIYKQLLQKKGRRPGFREILFSIDCGSGHSIYSEFSSVRSTWHPNFTKSFRLVLVALFNKSRKSRPALWFETVEKPDYPAALQAAMRESQFKLMLPESYERLLAILREPAEEASVSMGSEERDHPRSASSLEAQKISKELIKKLEIKERKGSGGGCNEYWND